MRQALRRAAGGAATVPRPQFRLVRLDAFVQSVAFLQAVSKVMVVVRLRWIQPDSIVELLNGVVEPAIRMRLCALVKAQFSRRIFWHIHRDGSRCNSSDERLAYILAWIFSRESRRRHAREARSWAIFGPDRSR